LVLWKKCSSRKWRHDWECRSEDDEDEEDDEESELHLGLRSFLKVICRFGKVVSVSALVVFLVFGFGIELEKRKITSTSSVSRDPRSEIALWFIFTTHFGKELYSGDKSQINITTILFS
jgi:putative Ca2+/H+ antiporter (TMEM165/GDT1 family)